MGKFDRSSGRKAKGKKRQSKAAFKRDSRGNGRSNSKGSRDRSSSRPKTFEEFQREGGRRNSKRNSRNRRDFVKTKVICDSCGAKCDVPFKPTSNKPIYCNDCFGNDKKTSKGTKSTNSDKQLEMINKKLDKIMKALKLKL